MYREIFSLGHERNPWALYGRNGKLRQEGTVRKHRGSLRLKSQPSVKKPVVKSFTMFTAENPRVAKRSRPNNLVRT